MGEPDSSTGVGKNYCNSADLKPFLDTVSQHQTAVHLEKQKQWYRYNLLGLDPTQFIKNGFYSGYSSFKETTSYCK